VLQDNIVHKEPNANRLDDSVNLFIFNVCKIVKTVENVLVVSFALVG
jgi:hypothetical protein